MIQGDFRLNAVLIYRVRHDRGEDCSLLFLIAPCPSRNQLLTCYVLWDRDNGGDTFGHPNLSGEKPGVVAVSSRRNKSSILCFSRAESGSCKGYTTVYWRPCGDDLRNQWGGEKDDYICDTIINPVLNTEINKC